MSTTDRTSAEQGSEPPTGADVRAKASEVGEEAKAAAHDMAESGKHEIAAQAEQAKRNVADEVSNVASALRSASGQLRDGSPQERTFSQVADSLADASESMRDKDFGEIVRDLQDYAREHPSIFLGGAVLLGFAAARFSKASASESAESTGNTSPGEASSVNQNSPPPIQPVAGGHRNEIKA